MIKTVEGVVKEGRLKLNGSLKGVKSAKAVLLVIDGGMQIEGGIASLIKAAGVIKHGPDPMEYQRSIRDEWES